MIDGLNSYTVTHFSTHLKSKRLEIREQGHQTWYLNLLEQVMVVLVNFLCFYTLYKQSVSHVMVHVDTV